MKDSWHTYLLIAVGLIVIGVSALMATGAMSFNEKFELIPGTPNDEMPPTQTDLTIVARDFVDTVQTWKTPELGNPPKTVPLFVSVPIVELNGTLFDMSLEEPKLRPPVSNAWLLKYNLDFLNSGVLAQDPDGDGFSSLAEWEDETDPTDSSSHPPYADKLDFISRRQQEYILKFTARPDSERFQIQRLASPKHPGTDNFYLKIGDTSDDGLFRVDSYEERESRNSSGINVDTSVVKVTYIESGKQYELIRRVNTIIPTYFAELDFTLDNEGPFFVKEGESFNIVKDPETKYRVEKVNEDSVIIIYQTGVEPEETVEIKKK